MTTLYLVRHGQTEFNVQKRVQGMADSALTPKGIAAVSYTHLTLPTNHSVER